MQDIEGKITELLEQKFTEPEFKHCFLIEINLSANNKLEVFIDSDEGVDFRLCRTISRYLEQTLDEALWLGEKYTLNVSSPGVARPLKLKRQYFKNIGRRLEVKLLDSGNTEKGELIAATDEAITLEKEVTVKQGKKKRKEVVQTAIPYNNIKKATVKISFK